MADGYRLSTMDEDRWALVNERELIDAAVECDPKGSAVVEHVNAEANVITALICHADGKRPSSV
jgi:hypothetical protein